MTKLRFRAKQGDSQAIAALLKTAFPVQPIKVTARLKQSSLVLHLESLDVLEQAPTLTFLEKWLLLLHPPGIEFVQVKAQIQGKTNLSWEKSLSLNFELTPQLEHRRTTQKQGFSREDTDILSFQNRFSNGIIFPILSILAWVLNVIPLTKFLLRGVKIWFHEFGHATIAWLSGRRAIPLPFGWTSIEPNRSLFVYCSILLLLSLLFWVGRREKRPLAMVLAVALALLQFWMTWVMSPRTFNVLLAFGGVGGEFYLCAFFMVSYFFSLPEYFRWDFYRFPVVLGAAFTFWDNVGFWGKINQGKASIPWGSLWGGPNHSGGDMNQLVQYGWSSQQIIDTYNLLGSCCVLVIMVTYFYFVFKRNRDFFLALMGRKVINRR